MPNKRKPLEPTWAPFVISGQGIAEGHNNPGTAQFAFNRRSKGCGGFIMLWQRSPDKLRYNLIDWFRFKHRPLQTGTD